MVGNPVIDAYNDNWGYIDFLYHHAMISDVTYSKMKEVCNFTHDSVQLSHDCIQLMYYEADNEYGIIDPYSIYAPACVQDSSTDTKRPVRKRRLFNPVCSILMPTCLNFFPITGHINRELSILS